MCVNIKRLRRDAGHSPGVTELLVDRELDDMVIGATPGEDCGYGAKFRDLGRGAFQ